MRYVEVDSMDDLPPLLKTVANQWSKPVVTAQLLVIFLSLIHI